MALRQAQHEISVHTEGPGAVDITARVRRWVLDSGIELGLLNLFCQHTSASLMVMENYDPQVMGDMQRWLQHAVPRGWADFRHDAEGPDDMPAHVRTMLSGSSLNIPVEGGDLALGTWQGLWLYEHRDRPHTRRILLHLLGE